MIWFTSDTHFGHSNIVRLCHRPFPSIQEMDAMLIKNWNEVVASDDTVYVLGDFAYKHSHSLESYVNQLNGHVHLILGNHDRDSIDLYRHCFESVQDILYLKVEGIKEEIVLFHYPILSWKRRGRGAWHLYGHMHERKSPVMEERLAYNVGVDTNKFYPISLEQLKPIMQIREEAFEEAGERIIESATDQVTPAAV